MNEKLDIDVIDRIACYGMYDNHTFKRYFAKSADHLIEMWKADLTIPHLRDYGRGRIDIGSPDLCPVRLIHKDGREYQFGSMVHAGTYSSQHVEAFRKELKAEPLIEQVMLRDYIEGS